MRTSAARHAQHIPPIARIPGQRPRAQSDILVRLRDRTDRDPAALASKGHSEESDVLVLGLRPAEGAALRNDILDKIPARTPAEQKRRLFGIKDAVAIQIAANGNLDIVGGRSDEPQVDRELLGFLRARVEQNIRRDFRVAEHGLWKRFNPNRLRRNQI